MLSFSIIQRAINPTEEGVEGGMTETGHGSALVKKGKYGYMRYKK